MKRLIKALNYSLCGLKIIFKTEAAFRLEVFLSLLLLPLGFYFGVNLIEKVLLISSWFFVLIIEIINSAIEATVDLADPKITPLAKKAKDAGSCAVLFALINVCFIWTAIIFF